MTLPLILASQSPRRKELLAQIGYQFTTQAADIDESVLGNEDASSYVERLAIEKARSVALTKVDAQASCIVLGSDTSVVIDGEILGKPDSLNTCSKMLSKLSNNQHQVMTSIAAVKVMQGKIVEQLSQVVTTNVTFKALTAQEIERYWQTGEPCDKAGAYGIQGIASQFVTNIDGCYFAVVGLPLYATAQLLAKIGMPTPIQDVAANQSKDNG